MTYTSPSVYLSSLSIRERTKTSCMWQDSSGCIVACYSPGESWEAEEYTEAKAAFLSQIDQLTGIRAIDFLVGLTRKLLKNPA